MTKYRINWRAVKTGTTGHGDPIFDSHEMAQSTANTLNAQNKGILTHWVELVKDEAKDEEGD